MILVKYGTTLTRKQSFFLAERFHGIEVLVLFDSTQRIRERR